MADDRYVALLRGINVGRAKRVAMADLRSMVEDQGGRDVRTLLNSGNVVFAAPGASPGEWAARIAGALNARLGVEARVTVLTGRELEVAVTENPLVGIATDPSRLFVAFLADPTYRARLEPLSHRPWAPEALAVGAHVAYLWCPDGLLESRLPEAVGRVLGDAVTIRNWATTTKIHALTREEQGPGNSTAG